MKKCLGDAHLSKQPSVYVLATERQHVLAPGVNEPLAQRQIRRQVRPRGRKGFRIPSLYNHAALPFPRDASWSRQVRHDDRHTSRLSLQIDNAKRLIDMRGRHAVDVEPVHQARYVIASPKEQHAISHTELGTQTEESVLTAVARDNQARARHP